MQTSDDPEASHRQPRRSSRQASNNHKKPQQAQDPISFLAELNVSLPLVASISQEIISLYVLWDQYKEDVTPDAARLARELTGSPSFNAAIPVAKTSSSRSNSQGYVAHYNYQTQTYPITPAIDAGETLDTASPLQAARSEANGKHVTPAFLSLLMMKMREMKVADTVTPCSSAVRTTGGGGKRMAWKASR